MLLQRLFVNCECQYPVAHDTDTISVLPLREIIPPLIMPDNATKQRCRTELLGQLNWPEDTILLFTLGPLVARKRIEHILWGLDQIRCVNDRARLIVVGTGDQQSKLERYARYFGVGDATHFAGAVENIEPYWAAADLFVHAELRAMPSLAVIESLRREVPALAPDCSGTTHLKKIVDPKLLGPYDSQILRRSGETGNFSFGVDEIEIEGCWH